MIVKKKELIQFKQTLLLFTLTVVNIWLLAACQSQWSNSKEDKEGFHLMKNERLYAAQDTGQIIVEGDKLRVGVGNIWGETYTLENGEKSYGVRAGLWLFFKENPDSDVHMRVHEGQTIET
ncbi:MAG TPA: hypothetical protein PKD98_26285, partial [Anaerolineae bacterium]|nr:hypothetical protein [Anaerolineae bacterium]